MVSWLLFDAAEKLAKLSGEKFHFSLAFMSVRLCQLSWLAIENALPVPMTVADWHFNDHQYCQICVMQIC